MPKSRFQTDQEFRDRIYDYFKKGLTTQKVAELEGIKTTTAGAYLAAYNVAMRKQRLANNNNIEEKTDSKITIIRIINNFQSEENRRIE